MKIQDLLHQTRDAMRPEEAYALLVAMAANLKSGGSMDEITVSEPRHRDVLPLLEGSAKALLALEPAERFRTLIDFFESPAAERTDHGWLRAEAVDQIITLIDGALSVRFSHLASFVPCLTYAHQMALAGNSPDIRFTWINEGECQLMRDMAATLDLEGIITVELEWPWERRRAGDADVEIVLPPFGMPIKDLETVPNRTLGLLGLQEGRKARLNVETVSIADAIENTRGRVILSVPEGELFRMVGTEPVARRALLDSGRLRAVMGVPSGMMFANTWIKTSLLVISAADAASSAVRFIDLGHGTLSQKGRRGRAEILDDVSWRDILKGETPEDRTLARDVKRDEILENNTVLVPERYLNVGTREQIDALLAQSDVAELSEVVDLVRPVTISADEEGEYTLLEAAPGDVNERGFVSTPKREITVDRAKYNKAFNQQLRPGDVLLSIKGTIGVVGLVPSDVPREGEGTIWTAGQSLMILRPKKRVNMSSLALYEYLSNDTVQEYIKSIAGGAAIQTLAMKDLKGFAIPMPDEETVRSIEESFAERQAIFDEIDEMKMKLKEVRSRGWPHDLLRTDG
ncbi:N-6 DNA methylase [Salipiger mangrovisoli]|uniref:N-6 DNA methylase n=1 Tax=Salipiger mangrovisoli TaxID=2865933 RepID=A0ABR9XB83_9RHOB|nr:N-6 DNA methylase [Salipiger mangrovisoli]MBE9640773.1 N-6 DNA methylase [Salipiger mangrovisoli]